MYKHILIPTDGSERSARAITQGIALAALLKARVTAFMATPPIPPIVLEGLPAPVHNEELEQNAKDYATKSLAIAAEAAAAAGVRLRGYPPQARPPLGGDHSNRRAEGLRLDRHGLARTCRRLCRGARQRDQQGSHPQQDPCSRVSLTLDEQVVRVPLASYRVNAVLNSPS